MSAVLLAELASHLGDAGRVSMLMMMLDGRAFTSKELASVAGIAPQTASGHLSRLVAANLLVQRNQGRNHYFSLSTPEVAHVLEDLLTLAAVALPNRHVRMTRADVKLRFGRTCYDHMAGWLGVTLTDVMIKRNLIVLDHDGGAITQQGEEFFSCLGIGLDTAAQHHLNFCRPCLDWTERRYHVAGRLGSSLAEVMFKSKWIARGADSRAITVTSFGKERFMEIFGVNVGQSPYAPLAAITTASDAYH